MPVGGWRHKQETKRGVAKSAKKGGGATIARRGEGWVRVLKGGRGQWRSGGGVHLQADTTENVQHAVKKG